MFEQTLAVPVRANRAYSTMLGFAAQSLILTTAASIPLIFPDSLPKVQTVYEIFIPRTPPPPPPGPAARPQEQTAPRTRDLQIRNNVLNAPVTVPLKPMMIDEPPLTAAELASGGTGVPGGVIGGSAGGIMGAVIGGPATPPPPVRQAARQAKPEPAAAARPAPPPAPIQVGGDVQEAKLIHRVIPLYPPLARQARVSGKVELTGFIATDGRIRRLQVLSGHPLLVPAALEAVRQWIYHPTLLNGEPVEVVAPITVHFILN